MIKERTSATRTRAEEYARVPLNEQIEKLNGLSARKVANIIHNSLMLVEDTEDLNYNSTARLYSLFTSRMYADQKLELEKIFGEYCREDSEFNRRFGEVCKFQCSRNSELSNSSGYAINNADDFAADIFANIQYRAAISTSSGKQEDPRLEGLAKSYLRMEPELKKRGIRIDSIQLNHLVADYSIGGRNIYRNYAEDFMGVCNDTNRSSAKMTVRGRDRDFVGPIRGDSIKDRFDRESVKGFVGAQETAPDGLSLPEVEAIESRLEVMFGDEDTKTHEPLNTTERRST